MKVLIASYARSGSTTLERALAALSPRPLESLHEPFSKYWGPDQRAFDDLDRIVASTDLIKHHPGNLLSDRQNALLYQRWRAAGGDIIHLYRNDTVAQAKSLVIARGLNSFHRPHNVNVVPADRLADEHADVESEVSHQAALLRMVPHVAIAYEDLLSGLVEARLDAFVLLLRSLGVACAALLEEPETRRAVVAELAPERQTRVADGGVRLVDQVPRFSGSFPLLDAEEVMVLRSAVASNVTTTTHHGIEACDMAEAFGEVALAKLQKGLAAAGIHVDSTPLMIRGMSHDSTGDGGHDLTLSEPTLDTRDHAVHFAISLGHGSERADGQPGAVHLAGRGSQLASLEPGVFAYFASGIGARREPAAGRHYSIVGALSLRPDQILCAGDVFGDAGMFR